MLYLVLEKWFSFLFQVKVFDILYQILCNGCSTYISYKMIEVYCIVTILYSIVIILYSIVIILYSIVIILNSIVFILYCIVSILYCVLIVLHSTKYSITFYITYSIVIELFSTYLVTIAIFSIHILNNIKKVKLNVYSHCFDAKKKHDQFVLILLDSQIWRFWCCLFKMPIWFTEI